MTPLTTYCWDMLAFAGLVLTALGLWLIYPPAVFLVAGLTLLGLAVLGSLGHSVERQQARVSAPPDPEDLP